jgi:hypothetical protein
MNTVANIFSEREEPMAKCQKATRFFKKGSDSSNQKERGFFKDETIEFKNALSAR